MAKLKVCVEESPVPSFTLIVIAAFPTKLVAGVRVKAAPERLGTTFEVDEVAE